MNSEGSLFLNLSSLGVLTHFDVIAPKLGHWFSKPARLDFLIFDLPMWVLHQTLSQETGILGDTVLCSKGLLLPLAPFLPGIKDQGQGCVSHLQNV